MMEKSGFFNSVNKDRRYLAEDFAKYFSLFIGNGVFPQEADWLKVKTAGGMSVALSSGYAWINGYKYENDSDKVFQIDVADGVNKRIDAIMIRWDKAKRTVESVYVKGNFSSDPVAPDPTRTADFYDLKVAEIYVKAGATQIETQDITDTRFNKSVCGIVAGVVDQIDTTDLFSQYNAEFQAFMETIEGQLSGDIAGNLQLQITDLQNTKATTATYTATITTAWVGERSPYNQVISVPEIKATDNPLVDILLSDDTETAIKEKTEYSKISDIQTLDGQIKVICLEEKPEAEMNIQIKVVR